MPCAMVSALQFAKTVPKPEIRNGDAGGGGNRDGTGASEGRRLTNSGGQQQPGRLRSGCGGGNNSSSGKLAAVGKGGAEVQSMCGNGGAPQSVPAPRPSALQLLEAQHEADQRRVQAIREKLGRVL